MNFQSKTSSLQAYHMQVYSAALHPEFFKIEGRRKVEHPPYELEQWVFRGGHSARFNVGGHSITEVITDDISTLPEKNLLASLQCAGERDHESEVGDRIEHVTSMQTETLSDHLYLGTYNELIDHGRLCDGLMTVWTDSTSRPNLSLLDVQRYHGEIHLQSYHLRSDCCLVLRTQSIFQVKEKSS